MKRKKEVTFRLPGGYRTPKKLPFSSDNVLAKAIYEEIGVIVSAMEVKQRIDYEVPEFNLPRFRSIFYKAGKHFGVQLRISTHPELLIITRIS